MAVKLLIPLAEPPKGMKEVVCLSEALAPTLRSVSCMLRAKFSFLNWVCCLTWLSFFHSEPAFEVVMSMFSLQCIRLLQILSIIYLFCYQSGKWEPYMSSPVKSLKGIEMCWVMCISATASINHFWRRRSFFLPRKIICKKTSNRGSCCFWSYVRLSKMVICPFIC